MPAELRPLVDEAEELSGKIVGATSPRWVRAVEQRAALERRLYELPALRQAMTERRLSYEKARLIARHADEESIDEWIGRAEQLTCIALRRALLGQREAQMCARCGRRAQRAGGRKSRRRHAAAP